VSGTTSRPVVTLGGARAAVDAALAEAAMLEVAVVVAVVDPAGDEVAFVRMDASPLLSRDVARDKAWTAIAFGLPSRWWAEQIAADPTFGALGTNNRLMPMPGGVPVLVDGRIAGAVGVSGATADEDEQIATAAVRAIASPARTSEEA
jgi:uncharacterized protein GlcG (DUF336 family)